MVKEPSTSLNFRYRMINLLIFARLTHFRFSRDFSRLNYLKLPYVTVDLSLIYILSLCIVILLYSSGDKAYIIGGMDDEHEDPLPNIECFDPVAMSWTDGLAPLRSPRFGHACCVIPADARIKWAKS